MYCMRVYYKDGTQRVFYFDSEDENFCVNLDGGIEEQDGSFIGTRAQETLKELEK